MEQVLNLINGKFISLDEDELKLNKKILGQVVVEIIERFRGMDDLFRALYSRIFYGGSTYDNLRIRDVENIYEFDLDMLLDLKAFFGKLWESLEPQLPLSPHPGYVYFKLNQIEKVYSDSPTAKRDLYIKCVNKLFDNGNLSNDKVRQWMESIFKRTFNYYDSYEEFHKMSLDCGTFYVQWRKGGPAFTLNVYKKMDFNTHLMDIDLVPCFVLNKTYWPQGTYRENPAPLKDTFFIVPKPFKLDSKFPNSLPKNYWRLSFQEQERYIMNDSRTLKPTIKLLKKLKATSDHKKIASYYIKSFALWELENRGKNFFLDESLSTVFITTLKSYQEALKSGKIPYYWDKKVNLIEHPIMLLDFSNRIKRIIQAVERNPNDPTIIASFLLNQEEYIKFLEFYHKGGNSEIAEETNNDSYCVIL